MSGRANGNMWVGNKFVTVNNGTAWVPDGKGGTKFVQVNNYILSQ